MEENKVATKLAEAIPAGHAYCTRETIADFILQSPDLRVELRTPVWELCKAEGRGLPWRVKHFGVEVACFHNLADAQLLMNSKEPK